MPEESTELQEFLPQHTLDYYVGARKGEKRNYISDYGKSRTCDHPEMKIIARGGNMYRCDSCNYVFQWPGAIQWPYHVAVLQSAFVMLGFSKEFGMDSLNEVLRRPIGQMDGTPHKPVLPEGMSFYDVLDTLEEIDVNAADGGKKQLGEKLAELWERPKEKALPDANLRPELSDGNQDSGSPPADADASEEGTDLHHM